MLETSPSRWIRSVRPAKRPVDPFRALRHLWEEERTLGGEIVPVLTAFLVGAECPFTCVFCDLWRQTLDGPTPRGAIPAQLQKAFRQAGPFSTTARVKLYNASNFFDRRAVPPEDDPAIIELLTPFTRVIVECHPRLLGPRCIQFAKQLRGGLEVAIGLETVHPSALPRLNKGMSLEDFDQAARFLRDAGIALRAFVLVSPPFMPHEEAVDWAVRSAMYAIERGAEHVSLIPVRGGNGALEQLTETGEFVPPTLDQLEEALERCLDFDAAVVTADLWDVDRLASCPDCKAVRVARLARINHTGRCEPRARCPSCGWM